MRRLVWFSCGAASAVAAWIATQEYGNKCEIVYCNTLATEHPDNARFLGDVENWIRRSVTIITSDKYSDVDDVFMRTKYMSGPAGARCTVEMKKIPRERYQQPDDIHIFGYTSDEQARIERFEEQNPSLQVEWILSDHHISKQSCYRILEENEIELPMMYKLGFDHNNCIGCVKASSPKYWQKIRQHFPEVFERRAQQSRLLGARLVRYDGQRIFLDELPLLVDGQINLFDEEIECGPVCQTTTTE